MRCAQRCPPQWGKVDALPAALSRGTSSLPGAGGCAHIRELAYAQQHTSLPTSARRNLLSLDRGSSGKARHAAQRKSSSLSRPASFRDTRPPCRNRAHAPLMEKRGSHGSRGSWSKIVLFRVFGHRLSPWLCRASRCGVGKPLCGQLLQPAKRRRCHYSACISVWKEVEESSDYCLKQIHKCQGAA